MSALRQGGLTNILVSRAWELSMGHDVLTINLNYYSKICNMFGRVGSGLGP